MGGFVSTGKALTGDDLFSVIEEIILSEREECARIAEATIKQHSGTSTATAGITAKAIRERGSK